MWKIFMILITILSAKKTFAQPRNCSLKNPLIKIDFGSARTNTAINLSFLTNYRMQQNTCPMDGEYAYATYTDNCFNGDWFFIGQDHTPGDDDGKMMLVNASEQGGQFFQVRITGLLPNTIYEFSSYMMNVCRINGNCSPLPPNIVVELKTPAGKKVAGFETGRLQQRDMPLWTKYAAYFLTPADETMLVLTMYNTTTGGCGNDFALDDITFSECVYEPPVLKTGPDKVIEQAPIKASQSESVKLTRKEPGKLVKQSPKPPVESLKTIAKKAIEQSKEITDKNTRPGAAPAPTEPLKDTIVTRHRAISIPIPKPIATRANLIAKQLEIPAGGINIDLYDNGDIDGDTVTIYHNNELIISRAGLSAKASSFTINIDAANPHHEIIMVANNLGSIPPNTAVMIITAKGIRSEVFLSSSEEKNAKVVIDLAK